MRLIRTSSGSFYRRWVNLIPSLILPGTAQFLSGKRKKGVCLGVFFILLQFAWAAFLLHPKTPWSMLDAGPFEFILFPIWLVVAADGFRYPIPCLGARRWVLFLLICGGMPLISALAFREFFGLPFKIPTHAMSPTLKGKRTDAGGKQIPGDHLWVSRLAYRSKEPCRGDVVVFKTTGLPMVQQNTYYVKRVVGLPGETVGIKPPHVTVNGQSVVEPPIFRRIAERKEGHCGYVATLPSSKTYCLPTTADTVTLGPSEYLVFGDNSTNSFDGRYYGPIQRSAIIGKAVYIYAPADRKKWLE